MSFYGKPDEPSPQKPKLRAFDVTLKERSVGPSEHDRETINASYTRWEDGFITFWESTDGPHDFLVIGYPLTRIRSVEER